MANSIFPVFHKTYGKRAQRRLDVHNRLGRGIFQKSLLKDQAVFQDSPIAAFIPQKLNTREPLKQKSGTFSQQKNQARNIYTVTPIVPNQESLMVASSTTIGSVGYTDTETETYTEDSSALIVELSEIVATADENSVEDTDEIGSQCSEDNNEGCSDMASEEGSQTDSDQTSHDSCEDSLSSIEVCLREDTEVPMAFDLSHLDIHKIADRHTCSDLLPVSNTTEKTKMHPPFCSSILHGDEERAVMDHNQVLDLSPINTCKSSGHAQFTLFSSPVKIARNEEEETLQNDLEKTPLPLDTTSVAKRPHKDSKFGPAKVKKPKAACSTFLFTRADPCKELDDYFANISKVNDIQLNSFYEPQTDGGLRELSNSFTIDFHSASTSASEKNATSSHLSVQEQTQLQGTALVNDKEGQCISRSTNIPLETSELPEPQHSAIHPDLQDLTPPVVVPSLDNLSSDRTILESDNMKMKSNNLPLQKSTKDKSLPENKLVKKGKKCSVKAVCGKTSKKTNTKGTVEKTNCSAKSVRFNIPNQTLTKGNSERKKHPEKAVCGKSPNIAKTKLGKSEKKLPVCCIVSFQKCSGQKGKILQFKKPKERNAKQFPLDVLLKNY